MPDLVQNQTISINRLLYSEGTFVKYLVWFMITKINITEIKTTFCPVVASLTHSTFPFSILIF